MITNVASPPTEQSNPTFPELSNELEQNLVRIFKLLADETRLKIMLFLARENELHVSALCDKLNQTQPAVSHHLALLRGGGFLEVRRAGKHNFYSLRRSKFHTVMEELFRNIGTTDPDEIRFDEFVITHET